MNAGRMEGLASDSPWNPVSRAFWGSDPETRVNLLFYTAIFGLVFSFCGTFIFPFVFGFRLNAVGYSGTVSFSGVPVLHGLILLWAVKMKSVPADKFRLLLGLLVFWSFVKILLSLLEAWFWIHWSPLALWSAGILVIASLSLDFWVAGMTVLLWKRTGDKEPYAPNPNTLLIIISVILIMATYQDASRIYDWSYDTVEFVLFYLLSGRLGTPLFWGAFTLLYIYRTEIEPWEDASTSYDLESHQTRHGISAFNASKLKEAKELLDNRVISEEEFQQIKDEYLQ